MLAYRRVGGEEDPMCLAERQKGMLRETRMRFDLVHGGDDPGVLEEDGESLDAEV